MNERERIALQIAEIRGEMQQISQFEPGGEGRAERLLRREDELYAQLEEGGRVPNVLASPRAWGHCDYCGISGDDAPRPFWFGTLYDGRQGSLCNTCHRNDADAIGG